MINKGTASGILALVVIVLQALQNAASIDHLIPALLGVMAASVTTHDSIRKDD